jgi:hypothetical protein
MHDVSAKSTHNTGRTSGSNPVGLDMIGLLLATALILGPMAAGALHLAA